MPRKPTDFDLQASTGAIVWERQSRLWIASFRFGNPIQRERAEKAGNVQRREMEPAPPKEVPASRRLVIATGSGCESPPPASDYSRDNVPRF